MFSLSRTVRTSLAGAALPLACALAAAAFAPVHATAQPVAKAGFLDEGSFALLPDGEGRVENARALAWSPRDEIHIVDERTGVVVYDARGRFLRRYGAEGVDRLSQIAIDPDGFSYVLDTGRKVVRIFDPEGVLRWEAGGRVDGPGGLDDPVDLDIGPNGLLYVLDRNRKAIQVYAPDGTAIQEILLPVGTGDPRAFAVAESGYMYVADRDFQSELVALPPLTEALELVGQNVSGGRLSVRGARLNEPAGVAITPTGTVVVANRDDGVAWSADAAGGAPLGPNDRLYGGRGSGRGSFEELQDVALAGRDQIVLLDRRAGKVERVSLLLENGRPPQATMDYPVLVQRVDADVGGAILATAPTGRSTSWFAIANQEGRGLRVVEVENREVDGVYGGRIGVPQPSPGGVSHDFGVPVEKATDVALNDTLAVVVEESRNRFHVFDLRTGAAIGVFGDNYRDDRRLRDPNGAALFADGRLAVSDRGNDRVVVFSPDFATLLGSWPVPDPAGVRLSPTDRLFTWNEDGFVVGEVPLAGGALTPLPAAVTIGGVGALGFDGNGNLYVVQKNSSRIAIMDARLQELLARLGSRGDLRRGDRVAVDGEGNIFATDYEQGSTRAFRWGVVVPPIEEVGSTWTADGGSLTWTPVRGSFVTGYRIEGAETPEGPWRIVEDLSGSTWNAGPDDRDWYRVAPITLTGSTGDASPPVPMIHLRALIPAAGAAPDHGAIAAAAEAAWAAGADRAEVEVSAEVEQVLAWTGLYAASEAGDHAAVLEWNDRLGGSILQDRAFEHTSRLAFAHAGLRQDDRAVVRAREAVRVARLARPRPDENRLIGLNRIIYEGSLVTEAWEDVVAAGEALIQAAPLEADADFLSTLARAHYEVGDMARSMELVDVAMQEPGLDSQARRSLTVLAFMASAGNEEFDRALVYADQVADSVPFGLFTDFQIALAGVRLQTDQPREAMAELVFLFEDTPDADPLLRPNFEEIVLGVYAWLVETAGPDAPGDPEAGAAAAADSAAAPLPLPETPGDFLARLDRTMPASARDRWSEITDRAAIVAVVVDTEARIGEGLQLFRDGDIRGAFTWFDEVDLEGLSDDQRLLAAQIKAWALYTLNRLEDADEAYRAVFAVDRNFILDDHVEYVREVFGFEIFTDEMLERFRRVRPILQ